MYDEKRRRSILPIAAYLPVQIFGALKIQPVHRLIQHEQLWIAFCVPDI
jgi:hypothetical protein